MKLKGHLGDLFVDSLCAVFHEREHFMNRICIDVTGVYHQGRLEMEIWKWKESLELFYLAHIGPYDEALLCLWS